MPRTTKHHGYHVPRQERRTPVKDASSRPKPGQPKYVLCLEGDTYYSRDITWGGCDRANASHLTHKAANTLQGKMRRLGYKGASVEPLNKEQS